MVISSLRNLRCNPCDLSSTCCIMLLAWPCLRAGAGPNTWVAPTGAATGRQGILPELLKEMHERKPGIYKEELARLASSSQLCQSATCPVQARGPGFLCVPPDKKLLEIKTTPVQCRSARRSSTRLCRQRE